MECVMSHRNTEHVDLADVGWMREKWTDLMTRTHGDFAPPPFKCEFSCCLLNKSLVLACRVEKVFTYLFLRRIAWLLLLLLQV